MKNYRRFVTGIIVAWFLLALSASALHVFENTSQSVGVAVGVAALAPIVLFSLWFAASKPFREFAFSLDARNLTLAQIWRVIGVIFVVLEAHRVLPAVFALPAGYGDLFIGATAAFVAWKFGIPAHRGTFILWQALGITDLVFAVGLGTTARLFVSNGPTMVPMTVLPLSLIPTFLVPLFLILHIICIAQARGWKAEPNDARHSATRAHSPLAGGSLI
ncbi:MAG TPA: hypothetical protein VMB47_09365 [Candidatus Aquilonibacter sp.]|nr:hypothetical protein [Candidatus Aquilonibacter sp.]